MIKLKPCPFCGSEDVENGTHQDLNFWEEGMPPVYSAINCNNCNCKGPKGNSRRTAVEAWNRRVSREDN